MAKSRKTQRNLHNYAVQRLSIQALSHRSMLESPPAREHAATINKAIAALRDALADGDFETLLRVEMEIQYLELTRYSSDPDMVAMIQRTQEDFAEALRDHEQLTKNPDSYRARGYRKQDRAGESKRFPLDTMRKTLRSQAARVGNFSRNPMLSPEEKEFHAVRTSILKRAEALYEELQSTIL